MISVVTLLFLSAAVVSGNPGPCPKPEMERAVKVFRVYDTDNNSKISRNEGVAVFKMSDRNSDDCLTPDEFSTEWTFFNSDAYMPFFIAGDENNDGKLCLEEGNKAFDFFDNDEDGEISALEFTATWDHINNWSKSNGNN